MDAGKKLFITQIELGIVNTKQLRSLSMSLFQFIGHNYNKLGYHDGFSISLDIFEKLTSQNVETPLIQAKQNPFHKFDQNTDDQVYFETHFLQFDQDLSIDFESEPKIDCVCEHEHVPHVQSRM